MSETDQIQRAIQALAQPAEVQIELFPDFVVVGDELLLDFDEAFSGFMSATEGNSALVGCSSLQRLDSELERLSLTAEPGFWLNRRALRTDARWGQVRVLAQAVLAEFGWPAERPGPSNAIYIRGK